LGPGLGTEADNYNPFFININWLQRRLICKSQ